MSTFPIVTITDELLAEIEAAANAATPQALDSAEEVIKADPGAMIECPVCGGEGYASIENDYCNFDTHAIGVQFYGIGPEFGAAEQYYRRANPATIKALLSHIADLKQQVVAAGVTAENCEIFRKDAERYAWLRELHNDENGICWVSVWDKHSSEWVSLDRTYRAGFLVFETPLDLDAAIDAARSAGGGS